MSCIFQNIDPPPSPPSQCVFPPHQRQGVHTRRAARGWGVNILEDASHRIDLLQYNLSTIHSEQYKGENAGSSAKFHSKNATEFGKFCRTMYFIQKSGIHWKLKIQFLGYPSSVEDHTLQEFNTQYLTRLRTYKIA